MKHDTTLERPVERVREKELWTARLLFAEGRVIRQGPRVLRAGSLMLGRCPKGGWELPEDPLLSREHLELDLRGERLFARDLRSRNGSRLGGRALVEQELESGDVLRLGDSFVLVRRVAAGLRPVPPRGALQAITGDAPVMHALRRDLERLAPRSAMVMLLGESGTGKGLCARALHEASGRRGPFVAVNCAAIPAQLAESTLFGHLRGAFTGAERAHDGFFQQASGGTLFLDEVADLALDLQPKLLHAVESSTVTPVGSSRPVPVDLRILCATSLDLDQSMRSGRFRGELHARLAEHLLRLPPLRERKEDLLDLVDRRLGGARLHPDLVERLLVHRWPYNIRELEKIAAELALHAPDHERLGPELVEDRLPVELPEQSPAPPGPPEKARIEEALRASRGSVSEAARHLGRSRRQLYRDLARLEIDPAGFRTG